MVNFNWVNKSLLITTLFILLIVSINSCSSDDVDSPPPSLIQTPEPETPAPTQYTLTVSAGEGGSVSTDGGTYESGTEITLTANPNEGYRFTGWSGDASGLTNTLIFVMNNNKNITANFFKISNAFFEELTDLNKNTSWYQTNINFNKPNFRNFGGCYITDFGISDQCGSNDDEYMKEIGGYIYYDFDNDGAKDLWQHFLKAPWPTNEKAKDIFFKSYNENKKYDSIYPSLTQIRKQVLSDFDNDGLMELMLFSSGYDDTPFPGDSLAIFIPKQRKYIFLSESVNFFHGGATGDINNDGLIDIYSSADGLEPTLYLNKGNFNFELTDSPFKNFQYRNNCTDQCWIPSYTDEVFDINLDGKLDIISGKFLFIQNSNGEFDFSNKIRLPINENHYEQSPQDYDFFDVNNDGLIDIIVTSEINSYNGSRLDILIQTSQSTFENKTIELVDSFEFNGSNAWWKWLYIIDFDYDGDLDLLADSIMGEFFGNGLSLLWWENKNGKFVKHHEKNYNPW